MVTSDPLIGKTVGKYKIDRPLGEGAMGKVYSCLNTLTASWVAMKVIDLQGHDSKATSMRFIREVKAINKIKHPCIIKVFDFGQLADGRYYYTMEHLEGETLGETQARAPLTMTQISNILHEMCSALEAIHNLGIVHRDLKPSNIFLARIGGGITVKLLDFGVAKFTDPSDNGSFATASGTVLGTPQYMSPEQAMGENSSIDHLTDLYSMGVITYLMFSGELPVAGETLGEVVANHLKATPPPLHGNVPGVTQAISDVIMRCLSKERHERFEHIKAFYSAFAEAAREIPPETLFYGKHVGLEPTLIS